MGQHPISFAISLIRLRLSAAFPLSMRFPVTLDLYLGGFVALALAIYLGYALFHPEKF